MIIFAFIAFALDRLMKMWTYDVLRVSPGGTKPLLDNVLHLTYAQNEGMSFGLFSGNRDLLIIISGALCVALLIIIAMSGRRAPVLRALGWALLGGALGNLYDRLLYGFVIDMFEIRLFRFAIFNVADAILCVCAVCVCLSILFGASGVRSKPAAKSRPRRSRA